MTVWALTALMVGRQGRFGEALTDARRAAVLAAESPDTRSLPLQPKFFLGLALFDCDLVGEARAAYRDALDDEFGAGWWLSEALMADAQASFAIGEWDDAVPGLIAGGQAAQEKGNPLLVSQSLAYRAIIATATGDHPAVRELTAGIAASLEGDFNVRPGGRNGSPPSTLGGHTVVMSYDDAADRLVTEARSLGFEVERIDPARQIHSAEDVTLVNPTGSTIGFMVPDAPRRAVRGHAR